MSHLMLVLICILRLEAASGSSGVLTPQDKNYFRKNGVDLARPELIAEWIKKQKNSSQTDAEFLVKSHCYRSGPGAKYRCDVVKIETAVDPAKK